MIDLHCHLLPKFDDGASSPEETRAMLHSAAAAGVRTLLATPHAGKSKAVYAAALAEWRPIAEREFGLKLGEGCEYEYGDLVQIRRRGAEEELCYLNGASALLVDFAFGLLPLDWTQLALWPRASALEQIVVAHPERLFAEELKTGKTLVDGGLFLQINAGSLLGHYGRVIRRRAFRLLDAGLAHVIASDAHRAPPTCWSLGAVRPLLEKRYGAKCTTLWLEDNPARLLAGQSPRPVRPSIKWYRRLFV